MARTPGSSGPKTIEAIKREATLLIYKHGYEAMNLRMLAKAVGIQPGSLYNHIRNKADLLYTLLDDVMQEILDGVEEALDGHDSATDALLRFIAFHITFHAQRKKDVFIGNAELRSLESGHFELITAKRRRYEELLSRILQQGEDSGEFKMPDVPVTSFAIIAMLTGVCNWYHPDGRLSISELIDTYSTLVMKCVNTETSISLTELRQSQK